MWTTGETITNVRVTTFNQGSDQIRSDKDLRNRSELQFQWVARRVWTYAPLPWKMGSADAISLSSGVFSFPSDYAHLGENGQLFVTGQGGAPLRYVEPRDIFAMRAAVANVGIPLFYAVYGKTTAGVYQGQVYPNGTGYTLELDAYVKRCRDMVDHPTAPTVAEGAAGALTGTYYYALTFVTASGETELGTASEAITVASKKVSLTSIPTSVVHDVTSRKLYRGTAADMSDAALVTTIADNKTTTYTDNNSAPSGSPPTVLTAVTGTEQFPEDFHESVLFDGLSHRTARSKGDLRDANWREEWEKNIERMWADVQPGQNQVRIMPRYGRGLGRRPGWNLKALA